MRNKNNKTKKNEGYFNENETTKTSLRVRGEETANESEEVK